LSGTFRKGIVLSVIFLLLLGTASIYAMDSQGWLHSISNEEDALAAVQTEPRETVLDSVYSDGSLMILSAPEGLISPAQTLTSIDLVWAPSQDGAEISLYEIYESDQLAGTVPGGVTSFTVTDLAFGTLYTFKIRAKDEGGGYSEFSQPLEVSTLPNQDEYEPNNTIQTAQPILLSQRVTAAVYDPLDQDYFRFAPSEAGVYYLTLNAPAGKNYSLDVLDSTGQPFPARKLKSLQDTDVSLYIPQSGQVYLKVTDVNGDFSEQSYKLRMTKSPVKTNSYDNANRLIKVKYEQGLYGISIDYVYDSNGNLLSRKLTKTEINPE